MPDEGNPTPPAGGDGTNNNLNPQTPPGTDPNKPVEGDQGQPSGGTPGTVDLKTATPEQLAQVLENPNFWKLDRITKLSEKAKAAEALEDQRKKEDEENLKKKGEWEQVAAQREKERDEWKSRAESFQVDNQITIASQKAGAVDPNAVLKLIDRSGIKLNEDGTVEGVDVAVTNLLAASPYLKGNGSTPSLGSASNPGGEDTTVKRFKSSQLKDTAFFRANEKDIMKAMAAGLIENDEAA